jgi:alpha-beta hydrolase superfamily lysophospholipase
MPTLVLHRDKDLVIPCDLVERLNTELAAQKRSGRVYAQYPNSYHLLLWDMEVDKVLDDIASWIKAPDTPLPSGLGRRLDASVCPAEPTVS